MRWLKRVFVVVVVLLLAGTGFMVWTIRRSFPQVSGQVTVPGLEAAVTVYRDEWGIPHIMAETAHDLFFAQGYVHAQERFWQMDFWRHVGAGRLSELFGSSQIPTDVFLRSLGFTALAEEELAAMDPAVRDILEWYADGVNAYLAERNGASLSLEYAVLGLQNAAYEVEPWDPIHTLTWAKLMSWDLSSNMLDEIGRAVLARTIPLQRVEELYPPYPGDRPVIVEGFESQGRVSPAPLSEEAFHALTRAGRQARRLHALTGGGFEGIGSNSWVVDGTRTTTGAPILANDTHLGIQMPAIWFVNGLHCARAGPECPDRMVGLTFAGAPGVVVGHNGHHAWGVTTQAVDTQDLFIERVNPENRMQYEVEGSWIDFDTRTETLEVAGGDDHVFQVLATRHGPVISDIFLEDDELTGSTAFDQPDDYVVALAWQSLEPSTLVEGIVGMSRARTYSEFREAVSQWDIAAQNVVYADVRGDIAYHSTGKVPIRAAGDGRYPVPGWTSEFEWIGVVPSEEMPSVNNPATGLIVTANNPVIHPDSTPFMGHTANRGYRAERIISLLENAPALDTAAMRRIQLDTFDSIAAHVVPALLSIDSNDPSVRQVQRLLRDWAAGPEAFSVVGDSAGAAAWMATWRHLVLGLYGDELPEDYLPEGGDRWALATTRLLDDPSNQWWDDVTTPEVETRDDILAQALGRAGVELAELLGRDPGSWSWGRLHFAEFRNQSFGRSGIGPIEWLFNRAAPRRVGGSTSLVNAVGWNVSAGYEVDWIPSFRMVVDLEDLGRSTVMHSTGQSGHAFHHHYDDMIGAWTDGIQAPMRWDHATIESAARVTLTLVPPGR